MARHFSKEEIEDIRRQLAITATHDTELPVADTINDNDLLPFVQDGENKVIAMNKLGDIIPPITVDCYTKDETDQKIAEGSVAEAAKLKTSRKIFNIPFDGTADVIGNGPTSKYPVFGAMAIAEQIYPSFYTRDLGGCGKSRPSYGVGDSENPKAYWWHGFYSRMICHNLGSNAWNIMKAITPVGDEGASMEPVGAVVIKVPIVYNALYTIKINSIYGSYAATNPTTPIVDVINIATSGSTTRDFRAKAVQNALGGNELSIKVMSKPVDPEVVAKGVEYYIVLGTVSTQYNYPLISLEATIVPGGEIGGPNPSYTWNQTRSRYELAAGGPFIDDVYEYITMQWLTDLSDFTEVLTVYDPSPVVDAQ